MNSVLPTDLDNTLEKIQKEVQPWVIPEKDSRCQHALEFAEWVEESLSDKALGKNISMKTILLAKAKLTDHYRFLRRQVNKRCRFLTSLRGHVCIFHIWDEAYSRLDKLERQLPETPTIQELQQIQQIKELEQNEPFTTLAGFKVEE